MAKADIAAMRDKVRDELEQMQEDLADLQSQARGIHEANAERAELHLRIAALKRIIAGKADEYGELARTAALIAGGTNYRPLP